MSRKAREAGPAISAAKLRSGAAAQPFPTGPAPRQGRSYRDRTLPGINTRLHATNSAMTKLMQNHQMNTHVHFLKALDPRLTARTQRWHESVHFGFAERP